jgi:hypothetical protein
MRINTTGSSNVTVGVNTLRNNTTGSCSTALGHSALYSNTTGDCNVAVGRSSLCANITGINNVAVGVLALTTNEKGNCNVAIGNCALSGSTSNCNIGIGWLAGACGVTTVTNTISIGTLASTSTTNNHTVWGNASNSVLNCVYAAWTNVSDCRDKTDIQELPTNLGLNLIKKLRPVKFKWDHRDVYVMNCGFEYGQKDGTLKGEKDHYGLIAQELKNALDELNVTFDALNYTQEQDAYRLTYEELIAPIIKSIQELEERVSNLENQ